MYDTDFGAIVAGNHISVTTGAEGYSAADGWSAQYKFIPRVAGTGTAFALTGTGTGSDWLFEAAAAVTAAYVPAVYSWYLVVSSGTTHQATPRSGIAVVGANPATTTAALDNRSQAKQALDDLNVALANWDGVRKSYTIAGRSMTFNSVAEILALIAYWERRVNAEKSRELGFDPRRVYVRVSRA